MEQGGFFNIPGLLNFFTNNPVAPSGIFTSPEEVRKFQQLRSPTFEQNLIKQQGMVNPVASVDPSGNVGQVTQDQLQQGIGGAYNLETGQMQPGGIMGFLSNLGNDFSNMSADETTNLVQGLSGLLDATQPAPMDLRPISMPSASAGLRLQPIDLNQYYGSLLK